MLVRSLIKRPPVGINPSATLREAAAEMGEEEVGCLAIWAESRPRKAAGLVTERDILSAIADGVNPDEAMVWDHMTDAPTVIDPTTSVGEAARKMVEGGFRHLPVEDGGETVAIISFRDLLFAALEESAAQASIDWYDYLSRGRDSGAPVHDGG